MEDISILEVLSQLEKDLKEIKSAKEQVDAVLASDAAINENLSAYSKQIGDIIVQLNKLQGTLKTEIPNLVDGIVGDVTDECDKMSNTISAIQNFASDVDVKLRNASKKNISDFNDSVAKATKGFSEKTQETSMTFSKKVTDTCSLFTNSTKQNIEELKSHAKEISESSADIIQIKENLLTKINSLQYEVNKINKIANNIDGVVRGIDDDLTVVYDGINNGLKNINEEQIHIKEKLSSVQLLVQNVYKKCNEISKQNEEHSEQVKGNHKLLIFIVILVITNIALFISQSALVKIVPRWIF